MILRRILIAVLTVMNVMATGFGAVAAIAPMPVTLTRGQGAIIAVSCFVNALVTLLMIATEVAQSKKNDNKG